MRNAKDTFRYRRYAAEGNTHGPTGPTPKTILIVEDDDNIGTLLSEVLSEETPYRTLLVTDGLQALKVVERVKPSLFITDYRLPYMNGIELYDRLCAQQVLEGIPAIIISAHLPPEEEVNKRYMIGINKPFDLDDLLHTVESLLNNHNHHQGKRATS